ncbi:MAG: hypothetical protein GEV13_18475, partial [Rhodospirillales bacterium]|nr:hypothetical protein [Rhodospirillales bacterium]
MKRKISRSTIADRPSAAVLAGRRDGRVALQNNAGTRLEFVSSCRRPLLATVSVAALGLALAATSSPAQAQTSWTGSTSSDWFDATNWNPGAVPTASSEVVLDTVTPNPTVVNAPGAVADILRVGPNNTGTLIIQNGGMVTNRLSVVHD